MLIAALIAAKEGRKGGDVGETEKNSVAGASGRHGHAGSREGAREALSVVSSCRPRFRRSRRRAARTRKQCVPPAQSGLLKIPERNAREGPGRSRLPLSESSRVRS